MSLGAELAQRRRQAQESGIESPPAAPLCGAARRLPENATLSQSGWLVLSGCKQFRRLARVLAGPGLGCECSTHRLNLFDDVVGQGGGGGRCTVVRFREIAGHRLDALKARCQAALTALGFDDPAAE